MHQMVSSSLALLYFWAVAQKKPMTYGTTQHRATESRIFLKVPFVYLHMDLTLLVVVRGSGMYDFFS